MSIHFSTLTNTDMSNNGLAEFVNTLMAEAGGSAAVTPVDQSTEYPVSGTLTFNGMIYTLPGDATQWTWQSATATVAWDEDAGVLVVFYGTKPINSTVATDNGSYASIYVYIIIAGGQLWWGSGPHNTNIASAWNIGTGTPRAAADTTRAMLTPLIADGVDMTPVFVSQNFVIDTAGTTVTDTAGDTFVSLGNLLYVREAAASEPAGTAVTCRVGTVSTLPAGSQATVTNSGTLNDVVLDFGIPAGQQGPEGPAGADGAGSSYTLPPATASTLGGVKQGSGLAVASDGTLSTSVAQSIDLTNSALAIGDGGTKATGGAAMAVGLGATASAGNATAFGQAASATGTSGLAVGSQAAASDTQGTAVGTRASATGWSTAVGSDASVSNVMASDAFGCKSSATAAHSVALGASSVADAEWSVSVGNGSNTRRITHVTDPTAATDAATKAYVDALIAKLKSDNSLK